MDIGAITSFETGRRKLINITSKKRKRQLEKTNGERRGTDDAREERITSWKGERGMRATVGACGW